ncbi:MAG TPA: polysaccharide biosynthesis/export family protein [Flavipsychrobacter sp.]|nr:polysaccharide biosynthesis/export family protein [Flavipsychrobacter sp.]
MNDNLLKILALWLILGTSCVNTKKSIYFNNLNSANYETDIPAAAFDDPVIHEDDILSIQISTIDAQAADAVVPSMSLQTMGTTPTASLNQPQSVNGFMVDKNGYVQLNTIGSIKVKGLTTFQARQQIEQAASKYYNNPVVQVRFANYRITVLGEVNRPSTYIVPNERVSILDALGFAGDLTIFGKRENVLLIRRVENRNKMIRLNLNDTKTLESPYFYLKQGDVIYVEATKSKVAQTNANRTQNVAIISSVITVLIVLASRINF